MPDTQNSNAGLRRLIHGDETLGGSPDRPYEVEPCTLAAMAHHECEGALGYEGKRAEEPLKD